MGNQIVEQPTTGVVVKANNMGATSNRPTAELPENSGVGIQLIQSTPPNADPIDAPQFASMAVKPNPNGVASMNQRTEPQNADITEERPKKKSKDHTLLFLGAAMVVCSGVVNLLLLKRLGNLKALKGLIRPLKSLLSHEKVNRAGVADAMGNVGWALITAGTMDAKDNNTETALKSLGIAGLLLGARASLFHRISHLTSFLTNTIGWGALLWETMDNQCGDRPCEEDIQQLTEEKNALAADKARLEKEKDQLRKELELIRHNAEPPQLGTNHHRKWATVQ